MQWLRRFFRMLWKIIQAWTWAGFAAGVQDIFLALWICRVSVFSVVIGLLLFSLAPQARDLFRDVFGGLGSAGVQGSTLTTIGNTLLFLIFLVIFWLVPVHAMARWSLERYDDARTLLYPAPAPVADRFPFRAMPFVLGFICLVAVMGGLESAAREQFVAMQIATQELVTDQLWYLKQGLFIVTVAYFAYATGYSNLSHAQKVTDSIARFARRNARKLALFVTVSLIPLILSPSTFAVDFRLQLVPVVLGAWVPLLSYLSSRSYHPVRLPVLTIGFIVIFLLLWWREGHEVQTMNATTAAPHRLAPIEFDKAVARWQEANGCADAPADCPHPIVVAAAGGASRAAFLAASVLGFFMDETCASAPEPSPEQKPREKPAGCAETPLFAQRVFAISSVSGGALGAGIFAAMLREHQDHRQTSGEPCRKASGFWFRSTAPKGWRECLQAVLAADFLSPAILGLAFRDQVAFLGYALPDRAAILQGAWSENFRSLVLDPSAAADDIAARGLNAAFDEFGPQSAAAGWRPLLVMNGTSAASGRRIVISHLAMGQDTDPLFTDAYELRNLINIGRVDDDPARTISLATAITNSARFPIVSPPGVIHDVRGEVVDRIVDGGYFENNGITTANDIVRALLARKLRPVVLQLTNDPLSVERVRQLDAHPNSVPLLPEESGRLWAAGVSAPFLALYNTRASRADLVLIRAGQGPAYPVDVPPVAHVTVYGDPLNPIDKGGAPQARPTTFRDVSMSWWLSKPMQEYIDAQLFDSDLSKGEQKDMLERVCTWLQRPNGRDADLRKRCSDGLERAYNRPSKLKADF